MDQLLAVLAVDPRRLADHVARYETWRTAQGATADSDLVDRVPLAEPLRKRRLLTRLAKTPAAISAPPPAPTLKLYQPGHQRFYIACATLACAIPGLPDRKLGGNQEQVGFVLRRLMPATRNAAPGAPLYEHAFIKDAAGARWQRVSADDEAVLAPGEERLPAFPLGLDDGNGVRRTLWGGLIPVGRREEYMSASVTREPKPLVEGQQAALAGLPPPPRRNSKLARTVEFRIDFAEGWRNLIQSAMKAADEIHSDTGDGYSPANQQLQIRNRNLQYQSQSWLLLLDFWAFLARHLPTVATAVQSHSPAGLSGGRLELYNWLSAQIGTGDQEKLAHGFHAAGVDATGRPAYLRSVAEALRAVAAAGVAAKLEAVETDYNDLPAERSLWPDFHYLLAGIWSANEAEGIDAHGTFRTLGNIGSAAAGDPDVAAMTAPLVAPPLPAKPGATPPPTAFDLNLVDRLTVLVARALDATDEADARPLPFAQQLAQSMQESLGDTGKFRLRFVHLNEDCGPLHPPTFSEPSEAFELASFFDSDAPARPVRITCRWTPARPACASMPRHRLRPVQHAVRAGAAGKGLGFIDLVRQVLPWPLHKDIDVGSGGGCKTATASTSA
jgi:hypothetical protein